MAQFSGIRKKKHRLHNQAKEEMFALFKQSRETFPSDESLHYAKHAFLFAKRHKIPLSRSVKESFCKTCQTPLFLGVNARLRLSKTRCKVLTCLSCGSIKRFGYK